jgi:gliding motility-associated-like protein
MKSTSTYPRNDSFIYCSSFIKCLLLLFVTIVFAINKVTAQCGAGAAVQVATAPTGASDPAWAGVYQNIIGASPANTVTNDNGHTPPTFTSDGFPLLGSPTAREADFGTPTWQALWTTTAVYILVTVPDDSVNFDPILHDPFFYNYDAVEVYLSGDNAHAATPPYGPDDVQYGFSGTNSVYRGFDAADGGTGAGSSTTGVTNTAVVTPGVGYTEFITIPLASFSSPTAMNSQVSLDIAIDDNDHTPNIATQMAIDSAFLTTPAGGSWPPTAVLPTKSAQSISQGFRSGGDWRDAQVAWNSTTNQAPYSTTGDLGNLRLTAPPTTTMGNTQTLCSSGFITLAGTPPTNPAFAATWSPTGGSAMLIDLSSADSVATPWLDNNASFTPKLGTGTYVFTWTISNTFCTATTSHSDDTVFVKASVTPTFNLLPNICTGATAPVIPTISTNPTTPITGTWSPMPVDNTTTGTYFFTPTPGLCANFVTLVQTVLPATITPTFNPLVTICSATTPQTLQTTSNNGITGTWSPTVVNNTTDGTYSFTPGPGQCALTTTLTQSITARTTPTFAAFPAICSGAAAPALPGTSANGYTGTWSPTTISNTVTGTYIFTPSAGLCATTASLVQTITPPTIVPTFAPLAAICQGSAAPPLLGTSTNGITGTWSPAAVSNAASGTYIFTPTAGLCALTTNITETVNDPVTPTFTPLPAICISTPAPTLPAISNNGFTGTWSPSTVSNTVTATYIFTPTAGQCATTATLIQTINPPTTVPTFNPLPNICSGATPPILPGTSNNGITGVWSPTTVSNTAPGTYIFTPGVGQCAVTTTLTETINPATIVPTFNALPNICSGATAPTLQGTSNNGIIGIWTPATVNNTAPGTYTFVPNTGQCALTTTITQAINPPTIVPTFNALPNICSGATAPTLQGTSNNGIIGVWSPATVSNTTPGTYIFTPNTGQCGLTTTITQAINPATITPTFNALPAICSGSTAPTLQGTSNNGIIGTWSPAIVSNTTAGTYTFTPNIGQCALTTTISQAINPSTIPPTFAPLSAICTGGIAPILLTTSTNGITGTWSPATVSNTITATYTFTPVTGLCATQATLVQIINAETIPTFAPLPAICMGAAAPTLPTSSLEGITGIWSPAAVNNTATGTYTFTPAGGQCATTTTIVQTVNSGSITPVFPALPAICNGGIAPILSGTSTNGITGAWSPATVSNTISGTYTFTPVTGQCATSTTVTQIITPNATPTFTALSVICSGATAPILPAASLESITGTWSPATVNNTTAGTYTFTPTIGQCALTTTITEAINPATITPAFVALAAICNGSAAPILLTTSTDGITGTWSPTTVNNTTNGTYTFTPAIGQCALTTTLTQSITTPTTPTFTALAAICSGAAASTLPAASLESITGTWNPATIDNTATATYTFTPTAGQCATTATIVQTVNSGTITPTFAPLSAICSGAIAPILSSTSSNGISGVWSPTTVSNITTATYTFTPATGQCATPAVILSQTITPNVTPTFTGLAAICNGSAATALPGTSTNGITGIWSPATIDNTNSGTYTFTPTSGVCTLTTTIAQVVNPNIPPTFTALAAICNGSVAVVLPTTSINGITGTWNPATIDNTTTATYTFTPTAGLCATTATLIQTVNANIPPTFAPLAAICNGSAASILSTTSINSITGTWSPVTIDNTTTGTYTFTPTAGLCATTATLIQTVNPNIPPTFTALAAICNGSVASALSTTSVEGITGTWSPATVSNTNSGTYVFTPTAGLCATTATLAETVNPIITPAFASLPDICSGTTAPALSNTSTNAITGTWSPATVSNAITATYTFTPTAGQCSIPITLQQVVNPTPALNIQNPNAVCSPDSVNIADPSVAIDNSNLSAGTELKYYASLTDIPTNPISSEEITASGIYYVVATTPAGCSSAPGDVTVTVHISPTAPPTENLHYCQFVDAPALTADATGANALVWYTQSVGGNDSSFTPPTPSTQTGSTTLHYYVGQKDIYGCLSPRSELDVQVTAMPTAAVSPTNIVTYANKNVRFTGIPSGNSTFNWREGLVTNAPFSDSATLDFMPPASTDPSTDITTYYFIVTSTEWDQCADTASIVITVNQPLLIPNIFSPNGDGINDLWDIKNIQEFDNAEVSIFNRYGQFIYKSTDGYKTPWDGNYHGQPVPVGTYFYIIKTTADAQPLSGFVAVVR